MPIIRGTQIKAARAMLDWSQEDLAERTGLGIATIRKSEAGYIPRGKTTETINAAFLSAGIKFTEPEGLQRNLPELRVFRGADSVDQLLEDMLHSAVTSHCQIVSITFSQRIFKLMSDPENKERFDLFRKLTMLTTIKNIFPAELDEIEQIPLIQEKAIPQIFLGATQFFIYQDVMAHISSEGDSSFQFMLFSGRSMAHESRNKFETIWNSAEFLLNCARFHK